MPGDSGAGGRTSTPEIYLESYLRQHPVHPWSPVLMEVPYVLWGVEGYERAIVGKEA